MGTEGQFGKMRKFRDGRWGQLKQCECANANELCAYKQSRRHVLCYVYFTKVKKKRGEKSNQRSFPQKNAAGTCFGNSGGCTTL